MPTSPTRQALTEHAAHDIVYSNLFTGVHGNYLGPSIAAAGLDPDNLPVADKSKMNFGSGGNMKSKAWRDIWGSGQGIGQITDAPPVAELVARLKAEFDRRRRRFSQAGARLKRAPASTTKSNTRDGNDESLATCIGASRSRCSAMRGAAADDKGEIRIGQTLPYSGPVSGFGIIGRTQEAYFEKVNAEGGINGRKIKFITLDDAYSPPKTVEQTRKLVEQDEVLVMFGSLGTATNNAVHRYLNGKKVPQLFVLSGATKWADPKNFPWTMPGMAAYESEGVVYAKYILQTKPDAKIAILSQNDDFGRDYVAGFKRALGDKAATMIVAEASYETSAPTISSQLATLKASGANVLFGVVLGKFTSQMIKGVAELNWKPDLFFVPTSASSISFLEPAGLENAVGLISSSNQKDTMDAQWANDAGVKEYLRVHEGSICPMPI